MRLRVHDPTGIPPRSGAKELAPRPRRLEDRPLYLVDCRFEAGDALLEQVRAWLAEHRPEIETRVIRWHGRGFDDDPRTFAELEAEAGAAILGVGI
jgi:hypothetical protein